MIVFDIFMCLLDWMHANGW